MWRYYYPEGWWIFREIRHWIFMILILVICLYFITRERWWCRKGQDKTPLEILKERYAKGEITKEEFDRLKKDLS